MCILYVTGGVIRQVSNCASFRYNGFSANYRAKLFNEYLDTECAMLFCIMAFNFAGPGEY